MFTTVINVQDLKMLMKIHVMKVHLVNMVFFVMTVGLNYHVNIVISIKKKIAKIQIKFTVNVSQYKENVMDPYEKKQVIKKNAQEELIRLLNLDVEGLQKEFKGLFDKYWKELQNQLHIAVFGFS